MKYAQLVVGPAGSGKSTYCAAVQKHAEACKRSVHVCNLDPAAEEFSYNPAVDVRDLVHISDVMEDEQLRLGPNGGLVYCMEYLMRNLSWLEEQLGEAADDYILFDCPGQIELYSHMTVMRDLVDSLRSWNYNVGAVFILDATFMLDSSKLVGGTLAALSAMTMLELPHVNVLTKMDLLTESNRRLVEERIEPDADFFFEEDRETVWSTKYRKLIDSVYKLIESYGLIRFVALDISDEESVTATVNIVDNAIGFGDDEETKMNFPEEQDMDEEPKGKNGMSSMYD